MRFDMQASLIQLTSVSDGMGGWIEGAETVVSTFSVHVSELAQELTLNDYGYNSSTDMRVFTRYSGLQVGDLLKMNGVIYKIVRARDFGDVSSLVVRSNG